MHNKLTHQQIRLLPKIDLHRHLDCSMRWSTLIEVAHDLQIEIPSKPEDQQKHFLVTEPMVNLEAVLNKFLIAQKVLSSTEILERLAYEACEDAFNDGIRIIELRYAPTFISDGHSNLNFEKIHQAFLKGMNQAKKSMPLAAGLIGILQRNIPIEKTETVVDFILENKNSFLAVDLADNEEGFEPKKFEGLFNKTRAAGLRTTIHSGETPNKDAGKWITDSIQMLGAERIGHGVQAINHPDVIKLLIDKKIPLEVCPYSNYLTQAFKNIADHPLKKLADLNVLTTINSDDPGIFASTLSDDYWLAQEHLGLTAADFKKYNQIAFEHSFISAEEKSAVWKN